MKKGKILAALAAIMMISGANVPIMAEVSQLDEVVVEADRYRQNGNESVIKPLGGCSGPGPECRALRRKGCLGDTF